MVRSLMLLQTVPLLLPLLPPLLLLPLLPPSQASMAADTMATARKTHKTIRSLNLFFIVLPSLLI
jgi:hypothetical protein